VNREVKKTLGPNPTLAEITEGCYIIASPLQTCAKEQIMRPWWSQSLCGVQKYPLLLHSAFVEEAAREWHLEKAPMGCHRALPDVDIHPALNLIQLTSRLYMNPIRL